MLWVGVRMGSGLGLRLSIGLGPRLGNLYHRGYRLGAPQKTLSYPAVASTEYQKDNQLGMRIPCINSLKKSKMRCRSPLLIGNSLTIFYTRVVMIQNEKKKCHELDALFTFDQLQDEAASAKIVSSLWPMSKSCQSTKVISISFLIF